MTLDANRLLERVAQITAHRACCGVEHDPANGKLHGFCVVCGVPWPCEYAGTPPASSPPEKKEGEAGSPSDLRAERNPAVLVEQLGDTHRAEYFEHYHGDRFVGVYVDVFRLGLRDDWHSSRGPYHTLKKARSVVKGWMRSVSEMARGFAGESLQ